MSMIQKHLDGIIKQAAQTIWAHLTLGVVINRAACMSQFVKSREGWQKENTKTMKKHLKSRMMDCFLRNEDEEEEERKQIEELAQIKNATEWTFN